MAPSETQGEEEPIVDNDSVSDGQESDQASDELADPDDGVHFMAPENSALHADGYRIKIGSANAQQVDLSTMKKCAIVYLLSDSSDPPFNPNTYPVFYIDPMYLVPPADGFDE